MVGYLGYPPIEYIQRSQVTEKVFDKQGQYSKGPNLHINPDIL